MDSDVLAPTLRAASLIRDVPDFPKEGIVFKDITPVLADAEAVREIMDRFLDFARTVEPDVIVGIESRGFMLGMPIAMELGLPFAPVRKVGKLPYKTIREEYALEYGTNTIEIHQDAFKAGDRVLIVDDLIATGGTARAAANLIERLGGKVAGFCFLIELSFLPGRETLGRYDICSLLTY